MGSVERTRCMPASSSSSSNPESVGPVAPATALSTPAVRASSARNSSWNSWAEGAAARGTTVTLDMEDSRYTEATIRLFEKGQTAHGNLGIALQSSLRRTPDDLARVIPLGGHVRLCKGAYLEPPEIAFTDKADVDAAYADQLRTLMAATTTKPAIATHDGSLIDLARRLAEDREGPFEFQMLYGVRNELQHQLVAAGFPVRIYLPFGSQWYPYLTRRLAERPANAMFLARAVFGN